MCELLFAAFLSFAVSPPEPSTRSSLELVRQGYQYIPSAKERAEKELGYRLFPEFPRLEIVKEGSGAPDPQLLTLIQDPTVRQQIEQGAFTSLQMRDLSVANANEITGNNKIIPFAVSIDHSQGENAWYNFYQGTIEAAGEITVRVNPEGQANVEVSKFYDSYGLNRVGRMLGFNENIDLGFTQKVVVPILENYFNSDSSRIAELLR